MVQEKMSLHSSSLESVRLSFYCNSRKAILNPHQPQAKQSFAESFWCRFFQKGAVLDLCMSELLYVVEFGGQVIALHGEAARFEGPVAMLVDEGEF